MAVLGQSKLPRSFRQGNPPTKNMFQAQTKLWHDSLQSVSNHDQGLKLRVVNELRFKAEEVIVHCSSWPR
jgi:protein tyrosine phosphatase